MAESATGSFLYPPEKFESTDEYLSFFEHAPISDQVLSNAAHAYAKWRKKAMLDHIHQRDIEFGNTPGNLAHEMAFKHGSEGVEWAVKQERPKWIAEAEEMYPIAKLPVGQIRSILRAFRMVRLRGSLPDEDKPRVLAHPLPFRRGTVAAEEIYDMFHCGEWGDDALTESDYAQAEAMNRVAGLLASQQGITDYEDWH